MAAQQVIDIEPSQQQQRNPGFKPKKYDKYAEEVVFEGTCHKPGVCGEVCWVYLCTSIISVIGWLVLFPLSICCIFKAIKHWRLYLTRSSVVYLRPTGLGCCGDLKCSILFRDIEDIYVVPGTRDIRVCMEPSRVKEYAGWCSRPLCGEPHCLVVSNVANGGEFVAAVKKEMGTLGATSHIS